MVNELLSPLQDQIITLISLGLSIIGVLLTIRHELKNVPWRKVAQNVRVYGPTVGLGVVTCFAMWISSGVISQEVGIDHPIKFDYQVLLAADNYSVLAYVDAIGVAISLMIIGPLSALATYCDYRKFIMQKT